MSTMTLTHPIHPIDTPSVRLTRRGRLVVFAAGLLVVLLLGLIWGAGSVATDRAGEPEPTRVIQVQPGDTLYGIAAGLETEGNLNQRIAHLQRLNALDSGLLEVGQRLRVPVG